MTTPSDQPQQRRDEFAEALGRTIGQHLDEVQQWIPNACVLKTHADLLRMLIYELGVQLNYAGTAVENALECQDPSRNPELFWGHIQLVLTFTSTAANIIWTSKQRRPELNRTFPARADDIQLLLKIDDSERQYGNVIALRDAVIHIDEKLEAWWIAHKGKSLGVRNIGKPKRDGTDFLTYDPDIKVLVYLQTELPLLQLHHQLVDLNERASRAFSYMMFVIEVEDEGEATNA